MFNNVTFWSGFEKKKLNMALPLLETLGWVSKNEDSGRLKEHSYIFIPNNSSMTFVAGKQTCNFLFIQF